MKWNWYYILDVPKVSPIKLDGSLRKGVYARDVMNAAIRAGYIETLNDANAIVTNANCGMCPGLHGGVLAPGDVAIACNTEKLGFHCGGLHNRHPCDPA